jgi:hypothetical protein
MKKRNTYWWIFVISGSVWAIGGAGIITGMILYPNSNLLGGFGIVFGPIAFLGSGVFQLTLLVWLIHKLIIWAIDRKNCNTN